MSASSDDRRLLEEAQRSRRQVEIVVSDCWYGCCSRSPTRRSGYEQTYAGVVQDLDENRLILHAIAVSSLTYHVVAELEHLEDARLVD